MSYDATHKNILNLLNLSESGINDHSQDSKAFSKTINHRKINHMSNNSITSITKNGNLKVINNSGNNNNNENNGIRESNINSNHVNMLDDQDDGHVHEDYDGHDGFRTVLYVQSPFAADRQIVYINPADVLVVAMWVLLVFLLFAVVQYLKDMGENSGGNRLLRLESDASSPRGRGLHMRRRPR